MPQTLRALAEFTAARLIGDGDTEVTGVASIASAQTGDLVFVQEEKYLAEALASTASAVIAGEFAASSNSGKPLLISAHPRLAFARAAVLLYPPKTYPPAIHATAVIHPAAKIAPTASIDAHAVLEANVTIGERTHIGAGCYVGEGVVIGDDCDLYPRVVIYPGTTLGRRVVVHAGAVLGSDGFGFVRDETYGRYQKFPQIGQLVIGDYVEIGANCTIDRGALDKTVIGSGTKLDNLVHIGHNTSVGENVVIAAQTGISGSCRDRRVSRNWRAGRYRRSCEDRVGRHSWIGQRRLVAQNGSRQGRGFLGQAGATSQAVFEGIGSSGTPGAQE